MRNSNDKLYASTRFAVAALAGVLFSGSTVLGAGAAAAPSPGGGGGGHAAGSAGGTSAGVSGNGAAAAHGSGGQAVGAGANTAPAASGTKAGNNAGNSTNTQTTQSPAASRTNGYSNPVLNQRSPTSYGYYGYVGNPWAASAYGWYGASYPEGAYFEEPAYTDNNNANNGSNNQSNSTAQQTQPQTNNQAGNQTGETISPAAAQAQLTNAVDKSPAMMSANAAVQSAQLAYDNERVRVMATLTHKPEYEQALAKKNQAADQVNEVKEMSKPTTAPTAAVTNAATVKLDASGDVTKMEEQAIAADPQAADAKSRLAAAVADRDQLRAKMMAPR